ncbi:MAG: peptidoglycan DD-metalloendopeptidase family protein [archaeon]
MNIFPELKGKWTKINLDNESRKEKELSLNNPLVCKGWVDYLHSTMGVDYSYGGFLEDRSNLWKDTYLKQVNAFIHLGIDYNVPIGTKVCLPIDALVDETITDPSQGGWGSAIKFKIKKSDIFFIIAHLSPELNVKKGEEYKKGEFVGHTGQITENGGWYPHCHVQFFTSEFDKNYDHTLAKMDGYLPKGHKDMGVIINPEKYVK